MGYVLKILRSLQIGLSLADRDGLRLNQLSWACLKMNAAIVLLVALEVESTFMIIRCPLFLPHFMPFIFRITVEFLVLLPLSMFMM